MNTVNLVNAQLAAGKHPSSLYLNAGSLELHFTNGEILSLEGTAIGDEHCNADLTKAECYAANAALAKIIYACQWEPSVERAIERIRKRSFEPTDRIRLYPPADPR